MKNIMKNIKIAINSERAGIIFLKGGYHAYWIRYSEGSRWVKGKYVKMWCRPRIEVCDIRPPKNGADMNEQFVKETCKPGTPDCCRYLVVGGDGWECLKLTFLKETLDFRVEVLNNMKAKGDNCGGVPNGKL